MKLVESKLYGQLIVISDYLILGMLWVVVSLPLITIVPATVATLYVIEQWRFGTTGNILKTFFKGIKLRLFINVILSVLVILFFFLTDSMMQNGSTLIMISGFSVTLIFFMFLLEWCYNLIKYEKVSLRKIFENATLNVILQFIPNLLGYSLTVSFVILVFLFPPFIFIFSGAFWKCIHLLLNWKVRNLNE